jgi:hypothetical protein
MGFLDNLENTLKGLESQQQSDPEEVRRQREIREAERVEALAAAPFANELKNGAFTKNLLDHCVALGHSTRTKVQMSWLDTTLRLQARERRLELRPTKAGVIAHFFNGNDETAQEAVDLQGDPKVLAQKWMSVS